MSILRIATNLTFPATNNKEKLSLQKMKNAIFAPQLNLQLEAKSFSFLMRLRKPFARSLVQANSFLIRLVILFLIASLPNQSFTQPGSLDNSFGSSGVIINPIGDFRDEINSLVIQSDGKIIVGGFSQSSFTSSDFILMRYHKDGVLDATFGTDGIVITSLENRSVGRSLAIQSDEKIILGGFSKWFVNLVRYNKDGTLDISFGLDGKVITDIEGYYSEKCQSIAIQNDGKILTGGYCQHNSNDQSYSFLVRYNEDGSLDDTFGINGTVIGIAARTNSIAIQDDGKILLGGSSSGAFDLQRYNANGTPDISFGIQGNVTTAIGYYSEANSVFSYSDGKILVGGYSHDDAADNYNFVLAKYNSDGNLDNTFGSSGKVITSVESNRDSQGNALAIQGDGKILLSGFVNDDFNKAKFALFRYNSNGDLDNLFGTNGKVVTSIGDSFSNSYSLGIQNDGKIVLGGRTYNDSSNIDVALVRYNGDTKVETNEIFENQKNLEIYPNPFNSSTTIRFSTSLQNANLSIYDSSGKIVGQVRNISGEDIQVHRNNLPAGIYFLKLSEKNKFIETYKLIINQE